MVSVLTRIFGTENLETAEDVVQQTFIDAMQVWKLKGIPEKPEAWLYRVAKNKAIDVVRRNKHSVNYDFNDSERILLTSEYTLATSMETFWKEETISDDQLRMMFACCDPGIAKENQITLILKTLCGFSTTEIAKAFITSEDNVSKRLYRSKSFFREKKTKLKIPSGTELQSRIGTVLNAVYLLFNEGYNSSQSDAHIRRGLIDEAMLLGRLLADNLSTQLPEVYALLALMSFHAARTDSRISLEGEIILLHEQDRSQWNQAFIAEGNSLMNKAAFGDQISTYHIEAAIAYEHCSASSFQATNWTRIMELYDWLYQLNPNPISGINRAVILLKQKGSRAAEKALEEIKDRHTLERYYLYHSLLGEIYSKEADKNRSRRHFERALSLTASESEKNLLRRKIDLLKADN